ncbi:MAG: hypothetical protein SGBAC_004251 [Bacillariaceae sp.]
MEKPVLYRLDFINEGAFKQVWQPHLENGEPTDFVLKTTFFNDYSEEDLLGDQQDGLVMERTTATHADIKGSQYLETSPGQFRLNDFNRGSLLTSKDLKNICPFYLPGVHHKGSTMRAPEEYEDNAPQDDKIDVFSLGSSLYQLLTGEPPFARIPKTEAMESIRTGRQPKMPEYTDPCLVAIQKAVKMCRQSNAKDRPWSRDVADFIRKELEKQEQLTAQ